MDEIVNKVAQSGIITFNLDSIRPKGAREHIDIAPQLWQGIALKEKDFRDWIKNNDWSQFKDKHIAISCSVDAIIPSWAFMLIASEVEPYAHTVCYGTLDELEEIIYRKAIDELDLSIYAGVRIMLKGCGDKVPMGSYIYLTQILTPLVKSLMFGEPCSAVPVFKASKK